MVFKVQHEAQVAVRFPAPVIDRLDDWRAAQALRPTRAQTIRMAVELFLAGEGMIVLSHEGKVT